MWLGVIVFTVFVASVNGDLMDVGNCKRVNSDMAKFLDRLSPLFDRIFTGKDVNNTYEYRLGICNVVAGSDTAVLQQSRADPSKNYTVGRLNGPVVIGGSDWINIMYDGGDPYNSHCGGGERQAHLMVVCDSSPSDLIVFDEYNSLTDKGDCFYSFELRTPYACPVGQMSFGSIFLIIFFSAVVIYFLLGICIMRFIRRSRGIEQIPHVYFWVDLGNLIADGCELVFRCGGAARRSTTHITPGYGGIGDDQLADEEEDKDDNLLPM